MRRTIILFALTLCLAAFSKPKVWLSGVPKDLAEYRANSVSNVSYNLIFKIPDQREEPVTGMANIEFDYTGSQDLPIDFQGHFFAYSNYKNCDSVGYVVINGKRRKVMRQNEHIILPAKYLKRGGNRLGISFQSLDASLNRHADYMYTLFVPAGARSCFPCFDQPDLKARFRVKLSYPTGWTSICSENDKPIPTYLFSFVAGKFESKTVEKDGRNMTALYRETDPQKVAQLDKVFSEAALSISWMEHYTGIPCPFPRYGFVVLPGYQFGGMEHPGAIQFVAREIFLGQNPTPDEELTRLELIAHETAHLWFGDLVTMRWFDDVWTKEVFANFMANKISREVYPDINHNLNFLKAYQTRAIATDRTRGTHPIQQPLQNLKDAGLLYGNIIYDKAPVMMRKMEQHIGADHLRSGLQAYLRKYSYNNATWDDLTTLLDSVAPEARVKEFSDVWVKQKGLPTITYTVGEPAKSQYQLTVHQSDPFGRDIVWPQRFTMAVDYGDSVDYVPINATETDVVVPLRGKPRHILPNCYGDGYGRFLINDGDTALAFSTLINGQRETETEAYAALLTLHENFLMGRLSGRQFFTVLSEALRQCANPLIGSTLVGCMGTVAYYAPDSLRHGYELAMLRHSRSHRLRPVRQQLLRTLASSATAPAVIDSLYKIWQHQSDTLVLPRNMLTTHDYTRLSWHLAMLRPTLSDSILASQRRLLRTDDERREFDFVSRGCTGDTTIQRRLFLSMIPKDGRSVEPWARQLLSLLCNRSREPLCHSYIKPGLDNLRAIQQSSDIFFPGYWCSALLSGQHQPEAAEIVSTWIANHQDYPESLMNKLLQTAYPLLDARPVP